MTNLLFAPLSIRGVTLPNRIMLSPMCTYAAGSDGRATDFHFVHIGRFVLGGTGLVMLEATAVDAAGRISHGDLGLWSDDQIPPLRRITEFVARNGAVAGIQLGHAGRRAATQAPWDGFGPLRSADADRGEPPWPVYGPTAVPYGPDYQTPTALTVDEIQAIITQFGDAAERSHRAGFRVIEVHAAHGYLIHSFLSPYVNDRADGYGGSFEGRTRLAREIVGEIRRRVPNDVALFMRISVVDTVRGGWSLEDSVRFARDLKTLGVDVIDCSSGGAVSKSDPEYRVPRSYSIHAPYSHEIRRTAGTLVTTVGLVVDPSQAEAALEHGEADIVAIGRELLANPNWAHQAEARLDGPGFDIWESKHPHAGWWLAKRAGTLAELDRKGHTPMSRYATLSASSHSAGQRNAVE